MVVRLLGQLINSGTAVHILVGVVERLQVHLTSVIFLHLRLVVQAGLTNSGYGAVRIAKCVHRHARFGVILISLLSTRQNLSSTDKVIFGSSKVPNCVFRVVSRILLGPNRMTEQISLL
jgi:hypothetical protein